MFIICESACRNVKSHYLGVALMGWGNTYSSGFRHCAVYDYLGTGIFIKIWALQYSLRLGIGIFIKRFGHCNIH